MGVTEKIRWPQRVPVKITKKYKKTGGELICKNSGVNGKSFLPTVGLCCLRSIGLVKSVWSFLLTVPLREKLKGNN